MALVISRGMSINMPTNICVNTQPICVSSGSGSLVGLFAIVLRTKIMALHAAAVDILIEKGRFEPEVALGIAEAIEASVMQAQFVTVPILDARLQELRGETRISLMSLEATIDRRSAELDRKIDRIFTELDRKIDRIYTELDAKIDRKWGELETRMERNKAELIRWVFLVMLGNVALSAGATALLNAFKNL
jgi:hypothetical protein